MGRFQGGGLSGEIFLWTSAGVPNSAPRPHPRSAALTHFPGLVPSPKFALGSAQAEALPQPPPPHHKHTHTDTPPHLFSRPSATRETAQYLGK